MSPVLNEPDLLKTMGIPSISLSEAHNKLLSVNLRSVMLRSNKWK